ncbi:MAG: Response regulator protein VraR [Alphaproteobacteria bacterium ADurb.BinA280]|jgi:DNA-binding NarL/FixJ family response regulator|nr:response regulator transcription factor [Xanthomonadales bacterium]MCC6505262.1 response regulator transcription factor [Aquimonas sp.]OPZ13588.1 MAG: Response regulator protein VraR [Alphaproteobacteria bacterium ADurb.BinA280]
MSDSHRTSILIALCDDQALVLRGLSALLRDTGLIDVALECSDAESLLRALPLRPVQVIVSDIRMPGLGGIGLVSALREAGNVTPVLLLTTFDDSDLMLAALRVGAQGFLLKDASPEELCAAIQRLANGETLLQPVSLGPVRAQLASTSNGNGTHLTEREASILRLVAGGYSNKEIARALQLSEGTIKNYITDILLKLDCRDRTHAVVKAIAQRLL